MHVDDDINVAAVHEFDKNIMNIKVWCHCGGYIYLQNWRYYLDDIFGYNIHIELLNVDAYILVFIIW